MSPYKRRPASIDADKAEDMGPEIAKALKIGTGIGV